MCEAIILIAFLLANYQHITSALVITFPGQLQLNEQNVAKTQEIKVAGPTHKITHTGKT